MSNIYLRRKTYQSLFILCCIFSHVTCIFQTCFLAYFRLLLLHLIRSLVIKKMWARSTLVRSMQTWRLLLATTVSPNMPAVSKFSRIDMCRKCTVKSRLCWLLSLIKGNCSCPEGDCFHLILRTKWIENVYNIGRHYIKSTLTFHTIEKKRKRENIKLT